VTAPRKNPSRAERQRDSEKKHRRHVLSPCDRPPETPTNLHAHFDRLGVRRYHRWRALFRWDEVHEDTSGFQVGIRHYQMELEYSAQDAPGTWFDAERYMVPPKDDNEPNDKVHFVVKGSIVSNVAYRFRVRAIASGGCKSAWSAYYDLGDPGGDNPPAPTNVKLYQHAIDRVVVDWDHAPDLDDDEILDERIAHYGCMISQHQDFRDFYKRDIFVHGTQRTFKVAEEDLGTQFFARAWTVGVSRDKSAKIPAKLNGNADPFATADGVTVDSPSQAKFPPGVIHKWPGTLANIPPGWLNCNGDSYSTTVYAELFAAIGYRYGGSGGQFNVPDLRGRHWKGARTNEVEGSADDGYGGPLVENQRTDEHGPHPRHKHKHHHRKRRPHPDVHPADNTGQENGGGGHTHNLGFNMQGADAINSNITAGGATNVAGPAHRHQGSTDQGGSAHTHPNLAKSHVDHPDNNSVADGPPTLFNDSTQGGSRGGTDPGGSQGGDSWDGGETDSSGNFTQVDEDPIVKAQGKGHRRHPHMKGHHIIKT